MVINRTSNSIYSNSYPTKFRRVNYTSIYIICCNVLCFMYSFNS
nr:MAG TPA: hypothetical protein [Bacteriophage sp.]